MQRLATDVFLRALGADHRSLATAYGAMGDVHYNKGQPHAAVHYHRRALALQLQALPLDHPDVTQTYLDLGFDYRMQEDHTAECPGCFTVHNATNIASCGVLWQKAEVIS